MRSRVASASVAAAAAAAVRQPTSARAEDYVCGGEHSLAVSKGGQCFSTGACGLGWTRLQDLRPDLFKWRRCGIDERVARATGGYYHSLAISESGRVYAWGCGVFSDGGNDGAIPALGQPEQTSETLFPAPVAVPGKAVAAAAGAYHSAVLAGGRVFTFGAAQLGQLGRSVGAATDSAGIPVDARPRPVEGLPEGSVAEGVGAAFYNTLVRCRGGGVFCSGENQYGQCGAGDRNLHAMKRIAELDGYGPIAECGGGYCHNLFRTADGRVLSMGCGDDGQRGDGADDDDDAGERPAVSLARLPAAAVGVAAGANHSLALCAGGDVYAWGSNEHGQLGLGDDVDAAAAPALVPRPPQRRDTDLAFEDAFSSTLWR